MIKYNKKYNKKSEYKFGCCICHKEYKRRKNFILHNQSDRHMKKERDLRLKTSSDIEANVKDWENGFI